MSQCPVSTGTGSRLQRRAGAARRGQPLDRHLVHQRLRSRVRPQPPCRQGHPLRRTPERRRSRHRHRRRPRHPPCSRPRPCPRSAAPAAPETWPAPTRAGGREVFIVRNATIFGTLEPAGGRAPLGSAPGATQVPGRAEHGGPGGRQPRSCPCRCPPPRSPTTRRNVALAARSRTKMTMSFTNDFGFGLQPQPARGHRFSSALIAKGA